MPSDQACSRGRVSVLIVNYRAYEALASCVDSLRQFVTDDVEVIVIDHMSEAGKAELLRRRFSWLRFVAVNDNPGFAAGVNRAAHLASGRHLLLLNPDCVVDNDIPHALKFWLDAHPGVGAVGGLVREADGSVQASARRFPGLSTGFAGRTTWLTRLWPRNWWTRRNLVMPPSNGRPVEVDWVTGACMMVRREAFDAVGGMDERFFLYWEDADLCRRLKDAGWSTVYHPGVAVTHLTGRSSALARRRSLIAFHRSAYRYFAKHGGPFARAMRPLVFLALHVRLFLKLASLEISRTAGR